MRAAHKRHQHFGGHHKGGGGRHPPHIAKHGDGGEGPAEKDDHEGEPHQGGKGSLSRAKPKLVSGNPTVVAAAEKTKSIGEVPGIYARKRVDRKPRPGGISGG